MSCRVDHRTVLAACLVGLVLISSMRQVRAECEKNFDAVLCDSSGRGYGFRRNRMYEIECYQGMIKVFDSSVRELDFEVVAAFTDDRHIYLLDQYFVRIIDGWDFETLRGPFKISEKFAGFTQRPTGAAYLTSHDRQHNHSLFLFGKDECRIYTQRGYNGLNIPQWQFSNPEDTNLKFFHHAIRDLKSAFSMIEGKGFQYMYLILNQTKYYKVEYPYCFFRDGKDMRLRNICLSKPPADTEELFRCAWLSTATLVALLVVIPVGLLLLCCILVLCWCYRKHQASGVFRHRDECCPPQNEVKYFGDLNGGHIGLEESSGLFDPETASDTTTIASYYDEQKPNIDLSERPYGKYGKS